MNLFMMLLGVAVILLAFASKDTTKDLALLIFVFIGIAMFQSGWEGEGEHDSTDNGTDRSGLCIYVDNKTGIRYLGTVTGLTVRLKEDGTPMLVTEDTE